jgi:hypothetical protein
MSLQKAVDIGSSKECSLLEIQGSQKQSQPLTNDTYNYQTLLKRQMRQIPHQNVENAVVKRTNTDRSEKATA